MAYAILTPRILAVRVLKAGLAEGFRWKGMRMSRFDTITAVPRVDWQKAGFMDDMFNWSERYPNFKPQEFACKCCGLIYHQPKALASLQALRTMWNTPVHITSGTRCKDHNQRVGGAVASLHLAGRAFDILTPKAWTGRHVASFIYYASHAGFRGIGLYSSWIHLDNGPHRTWEQGVGGPADALDNLDGSELE